jgi:hypothetical protein
LQIVDVKVDEKVIPRTTQVEGETYYVKETLLKKLLLNKVITPEIYELLKTLPESRVIEIVRDLVERRDVFGDVVAPRGVQYENVRDLFNTNQVYGQRYGNVSPNPTFDPEHKRFPSFFKINNLLISSFFLSISRKSTLTELSQPSETSSTSTDNEFKFFTERRRNY